MGRRTFLGLPISTFLALAVPEDTEELKVLTADFNEPYCIFVKKLFGCPPEAKEVGECRPIKGVLDYRSWRLCREAAKRLFGLKEK